MNAFLRGGRTTLARRPNACSLKLDHWFSPNLTAKRNQLEAGGGAPIATAGTGSIRDIANVEDRRARKLAQETSGFRRPCRTHGFPWRPRRQEFWRNPNWPQQTSEFNHVAARQKLEAARCAAYNGGRQAGRAAARDRRPAPYSKARQMAKTKNLWPADHRTGGSNRSPRAMRKALWRRIWATILRCAGRPVGRRMRWTNTRASQGATLLLPEGVEATRRACRRRPAELGASPLPRSAVRRQKERGAGTGYRS